MKKMKISKKRIEILKRQKNNILQNLTFKEKLENQGIDLSTYEKIETSTHFNEWWSTFLKIYCDIYVKNGRYYGILDDNLIDILIINLYNKNINELTYVGNIDIEHNTRKVYLYKDIDDNLVYYYKDRWIKYK
jgi:hypothetical protein